MEQIMQMQRAIITKKSRGNKVLMELSKKIASIYNKKFLKNKRDLKGESDRLLKQLSEQIASRYVPDQPVVYHGQVNLNNYQPNVNRNVVQKKFDVVVEKPVIKEVIVERPVENKVYKQVYIEKVVENPIEKIIENEVEKVVEKKVEKSIEKPVYIDKIVKKEIENIVDEHVERQVVVEKPY